jgi:hypothetical protein
VEGQDSAAGHANGALPSPKILVPTSYLNFVVQKRCTSEGAVARQEGRQRKQSFVCWGEGKEELDVILRLKIAYISWRITAREVHVPDPNNTFSTPRSSSQ